MDFRNFLKNNIVYLDGGMGTLLQEHGLTVKEKPEMWNITHRDIILSIQKAYFDAGSNVVNTNTFGANLLHYEKEELDKVIKNAIEIAKEAKNKSSNKKEKFVSLDIGPLGRLLAPFGDLEYERTIEIFAETVKIGVKYGVDLVTIETMNDSYETKAAVIAVKENCNLPILVSNAYGIDGKLLTGADTKAMVTLLEGLGVDGIGANCSLGPKQLGKVVEGILKYSSTPVILKPNAGIPKTIDGKTVFEVKEEEFSNEIIPLIKKGVRIVGGCCGTTPSYIKALVENSKDIAPKKIANKNKCVISSYNHAVEFGNEPILIGERINPTGKRAFKKAIIDNDIDYILKEAIEEEKNSAKVLDVNVGLPEIKEEELLPNVIKEIQAVVDLPLQIDTSSYRAMERALRCYNGKALVNSVNGKKESMENIFPLVKKYGGVVVCLTLDENGIPKTAEGRIKVAEKILKTAKKYGISRNNLIFDTLAMTVSADNNSALVTLNALKMIKEKLNCNTILGVSNISFGLPNREAVNGTFFTLALENGLSAGIINPLSKELMKSYYTYMLLKGRDENCQKYVSVADSFSVTFTGVVAEKEQEKEEDDLINAIQKGLKEKAGKLTKELLKGKEPLKIIDDYIIPALNSVGEDYENKRVFLPGLLMSAEASKSAFQVIKDHLISNNKNENSGATFVLATVEGDIHDIGKNIVKLLLENYGFNVIDLGKDVPQKKIVDSVVKNHSYLVGLSALMTTTVPSMEKTIKLLREKAPWCKVIVGGAVLTEEYSNKIGADAYAKDAMQTVRLAQKYVKELKI